MLTPLCFAFNLFGEMSLRVQYVKTTENPFSESKFLHSSQYFNRIPSQKIIQQTLMAHQEEGWPLGLRFLNGRIGLVENDDEFSGSMLTASPTSSIDSSSDLEFQSTGSSSHDKTITLGSLIGVSSISELSQRPNMGGRTMVDPTKASRNIKKKHNKMMMKKACLFSLCSKLTTDGVSVKHIDAPSLGHYLEAERRAKSESSTLRLTQCSSNSTYDDSNNNG